MNRIDAKQNNLGSLLVFLSAVFYSLSGLLFKVISWPGLAANAARAIICVFVLYSYMKVKHRKVKVNKYTVLSGLSLAATTGLFSVATKLTTAGNAIVLEFTMPVFIILINIFIFKRKVKPREIACCALVFCGIILFFIDGLSSGNMLGNVLALLAAVFYCGMFLVGEYEDGDPQSSMLLGLIFAFILGIPSLLKVDFAATTKNEIIALLVLGFVQQSGGQILFSEGIGRVSSMRAALVSGVEPILNPVLVAIFYGEKLTPLALVGAAVVLASVLTYNVISAKQDKEMAEALMYDEMID